MTLYNICKMIAEVEEGLMYGEISFEYSKLMCALKPGHPAEILDEILSIIGWDVFAGLPSAYAEESQPRNCHRRKPVPENDCQYARFPALRGRAWR